MIAATMSTFGNGPVVQLRSRLGEALLEGFDEALEARVLLDPRGDRANAVENGRVVATKQVADPWI